MTKKATKTTFPAEKRDLFGRKTKQLRAADQVPANIYGDIDESLAISVEKHPFLRLYDEVGDTGLIYLQVAGTDHPVLVDTIDADPVTGDVMHVTFREVNLHEAIEAEVPIEYVGEVDIPESVVVTLQNEVTVEALPSDFPESFVVDISDLTEIGQSKTYRDLEVDTSKVKLVVDEEQLDEPILLIQEVSEEPEPEETSVDDVGLVGEDEEDTASEAAPESDAADGEEE